jgi:glycosyltransferase involved in cell wall biosynthesis
LTLEKSADKYLENCTNDNKIAMKILLVMDPGIPVPPKLYGGIERIVYQLAIAYTQLGHEVTLLAGPASEIKGVKIISFGKNDLNKSTLQSFREILFAWFFLWRNKNSFNFIHNFGRLLYFLPILKSKTTKVMSYQRDVTTKNIQQIMAYHPQNFYFTGCSSYTVSTGNIAGKWYPIFNGAEENVYQCSENVPFDAPLMFLGRLDQVKGCHHAIALAKKTNRKLVIAGNISNIPSELAYYENEIKPHIDGIQIIYVGAVNDEQKNHYLGKSAAFLMLIDWNEPFGIVMAEALACGTPVIGFPKGAVSEVIIQGYNGFLVNNLDEAASAVSQLPQISRRNCRLDFEKRFEMKALAKQYLQITAINN